MKYKRAEGDTSDYSDPVIVRGGLAQEPTLDSLFDTKFFEINNDFVHEDNISEVEFRKAVLKLAWIAIRRWTR